jgi:hypothetical protein
VRQLLLGPWSAALADSATEASFGAPLVELQIPAGLLIQRHVAELAT